MGIWECPIGCGSGLQLWFWAGLGRSHPKAPPQSRCRWVPGRIMLKGDNITLLQSVSS
uniref:Uncharacterized protein n=1 Tax=Junco hyemalis TaxID=40217 RepID=A0A8C5IK34_JUNHY